MLWITSCVKPSWDLRGKTVTTTATATLRDWGMIQNWCPKLQCNDLDGTGATCSCSPSMFEPQAGWFRVIVVVVPTGRDAREDDLGGHYDIHQHTSLKDKSGEITSLISITRNGTKTARNCCYIVNRPNQHIMMTYRTHVLRSFQI